MDKKLLYGQMFQDSYRKKGNQSFHDGANTYAPHRSFNVYHGDVQVVSYFEFDPDLNPYTVRCFWDAYRFPTRGEMYDLKVCFYTFGKKSTIGYLLEPNKVDIRPAEFDFRPTKHLTDKNFYTSGWHRPEDLEELGRRKDNPANRRAYAQYMQDLKDGIPPTLI